MTMVGALFTLALGIAWGQEPAEEAPSPAEEAIVEPAAPAEPGAPSASGQATSVTLSLDQDGAQVTVTGEDVVEVDDPEGVHLRLQSMEQRFDEMDRRLDEMEQRLSNMDARVVAARDAMADDLSPSTVAWTGEVEVPEGAVVDDAIAYTGPVHVFGVVDGDAVSMVDDVHIAASGLVRGDAVSFGGDVTIEPGGQVLGDRVALGRNGHPVRSVMTPPIVEGGGPSELFHNFARRIALLLSFAGAGVLIVGFFPRQVEQVGGLVAERPFWYTIAGMILASLLGLGSMVLTFTLVGVPIAILLAILLALGWLLGLVGICKVVGEKFALTRDRGAWAAFLAGAALLTAIALLPWVGTVAFVGIGFPAIGAALVSRFGNRSDPDVV